jgi:hypothetical protein
VCAAFDRISLEKEMLKDFVNTFSLDDSEDNSSASAGAVTGNYDLPSFPTPPYRKEGGGSALGAAAVGGGLVLAGAGGAGGAEALGAGLVFQRPQAALAGGHLMKGPGGRPELPQGHVKTESFGHMEGLFEAVYSPGGIYNQVCTPSLYVLCVLSIFSVFLLVPPPLIHSSTHPLIHSSTHPLIHSSTHPLIHSSTRPLIHSSLSRSLSVVRALSLSL